jgi:hypothetical protein
MTILLEDSYLQFGVGNFTDSANHVKSTTESFLYNMHSMMLFISTFFISLYLTLKPIR